MAEWKQVAGHLGYQCSFCGCWEGGATCFCPHCGSFMGSARIDMEGYMKQLKGGKPVEIAEVVRCRDCEYYQKNGYSGCLYWADEIYPDEDDFCSRGERKDDSEQPG